MSPEKRIDILKNIGATIQQTRDDEGIRCVFEKVFGHGLNLSSKIALVGFGMGGALSLETATEFLDPKRSKYLSGWSIIN